MNQSMNEILNELKNELTLPIEEVYKDKNIGTRDINRDNRDKFRRFNDNLENPKYLFEISRSSRMRERLQEKLIKIRMNPKK